MNCMGIAFFAGLLVLFGAGTLAQDEPPLTEVLVGVETSGRTERTFLPHCSGVRTLVAHGLGAPGISIRSVASCRTATTVRVA